MQLVIDTNIWINACRNSSIDHILFVSNFLQTPADTLAVDNNYVMLKEYEDNLSENGFYQQCIKALYHQNRIDFISDKISSAHRIGLDKVKFHEPEDRVFLGCAFNADKYLVTEDSDYGMSLEPSKNDELALKKKEYIVNEMGVTLADGKRALEDSKERLYPPYL